MDIITWSYKCTQAQFLLALAFTQCIIFGLQKLEHKYSLLDTGKKCRCYSGSWIKYLALFYTGMSAPQSEAL